MVGQGLSVVANRNLGRMGPEAQKLRDALVASFPGFVRERIGAAGLPAVDEAVAEATRFLDVALTDLLSRPLIDQMRSPLELVREALCIPTRALTDLGAEPVARDGQEQTLLPEDRYALAPATARDMSEEAWQAHMAWGVAKARDVAGMIPAAAAPERPSDRPVVALVSTDIMDRSKLSSLAEAAGYEMAVARNPAAFADLLGGRRPSVVFVDLTHASADEAIRAFAGAGIRTIAFGPHVDDVALARARSLGAREAVPRSRFFQDPGRFLPDVV